MNALVKTVAMICLGFTFLGLAKEKNDVIFQAIKQGDVAIVLQWLDSGSNLDIRNEFGQTVLICAVIEKQYEMVLILRAAGVDKMAVDNYGKTAHDYAIAQEKEQAELEQRNKIRGYYFLGAVACVIATLIIYDMYYGTHCSGKEDGPLKPCNCTSRDTGHYVNPCAVSNSNAIPLSRLV